MANLFDGFGVFLRFVGISGTYGLLAHLFGKSNFLQTAILLKYACLSTAVISGCILSKKYSSIIGKNEKTGSIPFWSYLVWWPFHIANHLFALYCLNTLAFQRP
uniref:Uncharacterized protein n=1 Tax=Aplanochytrium stocchinoi TaxID=215587 RepID=A0A6S8CYS8_9STRA